MMKPKISQPPEIRGPTSSMSRKRIDLNLLTVFDMVMTERHVSRAADRLDMTQSAVSNALNRLRLRFQDRLFVKAARGVDPTPKAMELWPSIHDSLNKLHQTVQPRPFDAAKDAMQCRIAMVDITVSLLAPHLYDAIAPVSPLTTLFFVPYAPSETGARLMRGELDFSVGVTPPRASVIQSVKLWSDNFVVAARHGHPLMQGPLSLASFCDAPHIAINEQGDIEAANLVDSALNEIGLKRNVVMTVNQFGVVPSILSMSNMIAVVPARFASSPSLTALITSRHMPVEIADATIHLSWHQRNNHSSPHVWMKQRILDAVAAVNRQHHDVLKP